MMRHFLTIFLAVFLLMSGRISLSQVPNPFHGPGLYSAPSLTAATPALLDTVTSDPEAVEVLHQVMEASGGRARWASIRTSKLRVRIGNAESGSSKSSVERLYMDDWSGTAAHYRRATVGSSRTPKDHEGRNHYVVHTPFGEKVLPEFDQAHLLAGNLPAAAALVILRGQNYIVRNATGSRCVAGTVCIDVYAKTGKLYLRQEEWVVSQTTHLPQTIDLLLKSLVSSRSPVEEFNFTAYEKHEGLTVPSEGTVTPPGGNAIPMRLVRVEFNPAFDKDRFDAEVHQK